MTTSRNGSSKRRRNIEDEFSPNDSRVEHSSKTIAVMPLAGRPRWGSFSRHMASKIVGEVPLDSFRRRCVNRLVDSTSLIGAPAMREIQASEAKTRLPQLLNDVERGETIVITRHGRAIARIVPEGHLRQAEVDKAIASIKALRQRTGKITLDELVSAKHEGHKY